MHSKAIGNISRYLDPEDSATHVARDVADMSNTLFLLTPEGSGC
jgi:hypothetical protein